MSGSDIITLLDLFGARLPGGLAFSLATEGSVPVDHPLAGEIAAALDGKVASLPYARGQDVLWVTLAPTAEDLRRVIEDLRCWMLPSFGWEAAPSIVSDSDGSGQMGALLLAHSPQGYFRWHSRRGDTNYVIARLATMRAVIRQASTRQAKLRPTLEMLRRQFTLGLATGDRDTALRAIDEIDHRQLDTASNALSMRIRLAAAFGDDQVIVEHPQIDDLLSMRVPQRVIESVLLAHHAVYLAEPEAAGDIEGAVAAYLPISDRLAGLAPHPADDADPAIIRMAGYDAALAEDAMRLQALADRFPDDAVIAALAAMLPTSVQSTIAPTPVDDAKPSEPVLQPGSQPPVAPAPEPEVATATPPVDEAAEPLTPAETENVAPGAATATPVLPLDWSDVPSLVATSAREPLAAFLQYAALMPDACDPCDGDFVIELFTDSDITVDPKKRAEADQVLTTVIDAYVCEEQFPRRERLTLYQAVMDIWSSSRAHSTDPIDGQLLLTMARRAVAARRKARGSGRHRDYALVGSAARPLASRLARRSA